MKLWSNFVEKETSGLPLLTAFIKNIVRERKNDILEFNNLPQVFITGRKVGRIPSSAADVLTTDRPNDVNWDDSYIYILTTDSMGDPAWGRSSLDTGW